MTLQNPPYVVQGGSHNAALFRQAATATLTQMGVTTIGSFQVEQTPSPSMAVQVASGYTWVQTLTGGSGSYFVDNDASVTLTLAPANSTYSRIDSVYVAVYEGSFPGGTNVAALGVFQGTPSSAPSRVPDPTDASNYSGWQRLADILVPANATSVVSADITDTRAQAAQRSAIYVPGASTSSALPQAVPGIPMEDAALVYDPTADQMGYALAGRFSPVAGFHPATKIAHSAGLNIPSGAWTGVFDSTTPGVVEFNLGRHPAIYADGYVGGPGLPVSGGQIQCLTAGIYWVSGWITWLTAGVAGKRRGIAVYSLTNQPGPSDVQKLYSGGTGTGEMDQASGMLQCNAGDFLNLYAYQETGTTAEVGYCAMTAWYLGPVT